MAINPSPTEPNLGEAQGYGPLAYPRPARRSAHLSTGLRSPLSWLIYLALALIVVLILRPFWREALLAFALSALLGAFWILLRPVGGRRDDPERILARIDVLSGLEFEAWIVDGLRAEGIPVRNVRDSGDFGVDIVARLHGLNVGLQAKRYEGAVGNAAIQQVLAGCDFHGCQLAVVLTQSRFTDAARAQAERGRHPVVLIAREGLVDFVATVRLAARDPEIRRVILRRGVGGPPNLEVGLPPEPPDPAGEGGSGQEALEDLIAQRQSLLAEPER